ncbi:MAG: hypothetical protein JNJ45_06155 [Chthonomonas sp.]|nr:hypothetical protein [Chthonomonas sp.]
MGFLPAVVLSSFLAPAADIVKPEITSVSMFKNGYAFLTRKIAVKNGEANIIEVPQASLGTLWFWSPEGQIDSIVTSEDVTSKETDTPHESLASILEANKGRMANVSYMASGKAEMAAGQVLSCSNTILVMKAGEGTLAIPVSMISQVSSPDASFAWSRKIKQESTRKFYKIMASKTTKTVMMMSLERGLTWAPGYALDISKEDKMTVASKATILNELADMDKVGARLITGFPNLEFKDILDPFSAGMNPDQWLGSLSGGQPGGGFGGGRGGRAAEMMTQNAYAPKMDADVNWGGSSDNTAGGEQIGDLFFYDLDNFSSKRGSRHYQNLFRFDTDYKHVYTWEIPDMVDAGGNYRGIQPNEVSEVWHNLRFKNASKRPLTTGVATIFSKGELLGQSMLQYCISDGDCEVRINKALAVRAEATEEEVERVRGAIKDRYENPRYDLVTVKGVLLAKNGLKEDIALEVSKSLTGEIVSNSPDGKVTKTTKGLRQVNSTSVIKWAPKLKPGGSLQLEYTYKLYVPAS